MSPAPTLSLALTLTLTLTLALTLPLNPYGHPSTHTRYSLSQAATQLLSFISQWRLQLAHQSLHSGLHPDV
jgi:hypothetical protein